jgi:hypothetical protein
MGKKQIRSNDALTAISRSHTPVLIQVVFVYYVILIGFVWLTVRVDAPLYQGAWVRFPSPWLWTLWALYYIIPFFLALLFGILFRPFWLSLRNVLVTIFIIHGLYSVVMFGIRYHYLQKYEADVHATRLLRLDNFQVSHDMSSPGSDGLIHRITFLGTFDLSQYPHGQYTIFTEITQNGNLVPGGDLGAYDFILKEGSPRDVRVLFESHPQDYQDHFGRGNFEVNAGIQRIFSVDEDGKKILAFTRWAPLIRYTSWDGRDPEIYDDVLDIDYITGVDRFSLIPLRWSPRIVTLKSYVGDSGRDLNGNGLFEQLVITLQVQSSYEGPLFIEAVVSGGTYPLFYETYVEKGVNIIEYVVDGDHLLEFGFDGPYELYDIQVFNEDPECQKEDCLPNESFQEFFPNYITQRYNLQQFEPIERTAQ